MTGLAKSKKRVEVAKATLSKAQEELRAAHEQLRVDNITALKELYEKTYADFSYAINEQRDPARADAETPPNDAFSTKVERADELLRVMPTPAQAKDMLDEVLSNISTKNNSLISHFNELLKHATNLVQTENPSQELIANYTAAVAKIPHSKLYKANIEVLNWGILSIAAGTIGMITGLSMIATGGFVLAVAGFSIAVIGLLMIAASRLKSTEPVDDVKASANRLAKTVDNSGSFFSFFRKSSKQEASTLSEDEEGLLTRSYDAATQPSS